MTRIQAHRPLRRETDDEYSHRAIILEIHPKYLRVRLKGERTWYTLTIAAVFREAARLHGQAEWAARQTRRLARRRH